MESIEMAKLEIKSIVKKQGELHKPYGFDAMNTKEYQQLNNRKNALIKSIESYYGMSEKDFY